MKTALAFFPFLLRGVSLLLWMIVIFFFSSLPGSDNPLAPTLLYYIERKGAHVAEYAVLMLLAVRFIFLLFPRESLKKILLIAGVFSIVYGATDEWHQFFVPYRGAKMSDVMIDGLGILLAGSLILLASQMCRRRK